MLEFHNVEQNTDEWYQLRAGRITSSNLSKIMANYGKAFGDPAKRYAKQLALEQITNKPVTGGYTNDDMERGHEQEPLARMLYEDRMFCTVDNGGFFCNDIIGCSLDGLVGDNGGVEIKSAIAHIHLERVASKSFDSQYKWQLVGNMLFPEREWIDFTSYCRDFPDDKKLYVYRVYADKCKKEFKQVDERIEQFLPLIEEAKKEILNGNYINT